MKRTINRKRGGIDHRLLKIWETSSWRRAKQHGDCVGTARQVVGLTLRDGAHRKDGDNKLGTEEFFFLITT